MQQNDIVLNQDNVICRFAGVSSTLTNGCVKNIKGTNIAYVKKLLINS